MNIQGEEFNDGEIVLITYKHFNDFIDYVGYFYGTRILPKILGEFFVDFQKPRDETYGQRGSVLKFFKIKRVVQIRKLK